MKTEILNINGDTTIDNSVITGTRKELIAYFNKIINESAELYYNTPGNSLANTTFVTTTPISNGFSLNLDERVITAFEKSIYDQMNNIQKEGIIKLINGKCKIIEYKIVVKD